MRQPRPRQLPLSVSGTKVPVARSASSRRSDASLPAACHGSQCTEDLPRKVIEQQYATSLQQQVQLLQLENAYLKKNSNERIRPTNRNSTTILARGNEYSLNGQDWCRLPSFHPPLHTLLAESASQPNLNLPEKETDERVQTAASRSSMWIDTDRNTLKRPTPTHVNDAELLRNLEDRDQKLIAMENELHEKRKSEEKQSHRIELLKKRLRELEHLESSRSESAVRDKRALMEELLHFQKRLDELTPILAEKEARKENKIVTMTRTGVPESKNMLKSLIGIAKQESEKSELTNKLHAANAQNSKLQLRLMHKEQEQDMQVEKEKRSQDEVRRAEERVQGIRQQKGEVEARESELLREVADLKRQIKELQFRNTNERSLMDQISGENARLIQENSKLTSEVSHLEYSNQRLKEANAAEERTLFAQDEIFELRAALQAEKSNVAILSERLESAKSRYDQLESLLQEKDEGDEQAQSERKRVERELNALHALSKSLSSENKTLRDEKLSLGEQIEALKDRILTLEANVKDAEDALLERERIHTAALVRFEEGARAQHNKSLELEEVSRRLRELSESIPWSSTSSVVSKTNVCHSSFPMRTHRFPEEVFQRRDKMTEKEFLCDFPSRRC